MVASANTFRRGSRGWGMFHHKNHAAGEANSSIMVGMFVGVCCASQKPSEREISIPARTDIAVYPVKQFKSSRIETLRVEMFR
jgi:hypothetical protein